MALFKNLKVKKTGSDAELKGELDLELVAAHEEHILEEWRKDFEAPGFRKGHVPKEIFLSHVNPGAAFEEAAEHALQEAYVEILAEADLKTIGGPAATFTKLVPGNSAEFKINVALVPEVKLPDYKKISKKAADGQPVPAVTEEEVQKVIDELRKLRAVDKAPSHPQGNDLSATSQDDALPELTDEYVKTLGAFENVADFRAKLKENMQKEKEFEAKEKRREAIAEALIGATKIEVSSRLLTEEVGSNLARLQGELKAANMTLEDYLKRGGKTEEQLVKEHRDSVERQFKTRFILEAIAEKEKLEPTDEEAEQEIAELIARYPGIDESHARLYVHNRLRNEKVLAFLESQNSV